MGITNGCWRGSSKGGVAVQKPVKILALPRRGGGGGGLWPLPRFFWWICHSAQRLTLSDNGPIKVSMFPQKMTIHPHLVNISPQKVFFTPKYVDLRALLSIVASCIYTLFVVKSGSVPKLVFDGACSWNTSHNASGNSYVLSKRASPKTRLYLAGCSMFSCRLTK